MVIAWLVWLARAELRALIARLAKLKYKDIEAEFDQLKHVAQEVELPSASPDVKEMAPALPPRELVLHNPDQPAQEITQIWGQIVQAGRDAAVRLGAQLPLTHPEAIRLALEMRDALTPQASDLFQSLRSIRNAAANCYDGQFSRADLKDYIEGAQRMISYFDNVKK